MDDHPQRKRIRLEESIHDLRATANGLFANFQGVWSEDGREALVKLQAQVHALFQEELATWMSRQRFLELGYAVNDMVKLYRDIYADTLTLICVSERADLDTLHLVAAAIEEQAIHAYQPTNDLSMLLYDGFRVKHELYDTFVEQVAQISDTRFEQASLKRIWRCLEKTARGGSALLDIVRGALCSSSVFKLVRALQALWQSEQIEITRIKNRFKFPNESGWADCLINFFFKGDPVKHVCEVQLVHEKMMLVRKPMGAHASYADFRTAFETMEQLFKLNPSKYVCLSICGGSSTVRARRLEIRQQGLTGTIPTNIRFLTTLQLLDLSGNQLTGCIPATFSELVHLHTLNVCHNRLTGTIPRAVIQLPRLTQLMFLGNDSILTDDTVLKERFNVSVQAHTLGMLFQSTKGNQWRERTSWMVQHWSYLFWFGVRTDFETGNIQELHLNNNNLCGQLPESIGLLQYIQVIQLSNNRLTGRIPDAMSKLTTLDYLNLSRNLLTGVIPSFLAGLRLLNVDHNPNLV